MNKIGIDLGGTKIEGILTLMKTYQTITKNTYSDYTKRMVMIHILKSIKRSNFMNLSQESR